MNSRRDVAVTSGFTRCLDCRRQSAVAARPGERGVGQLSSLMGLIFFFFFMFLATHLLLHLYASSVSSAMAYDSAINVAKAEHQDDRERAAAIEKVDLDNNLASWNATSTFSFNSVGTTVTVRVQGQLPSLFPGFVTNATGLDIDRSVTVRLEEFRDP